ncbi:MAG: hypothetical protein IJO22_05790 [Oscillospiraceae bacterium]|nr:hypothetical protein [Oscillospiraceae bacterium]
MFLYKTIVQTLVDNFQGVFSDDEINEYGDWPHVFFGDLFVPYVKNILLSGNTEEINFIFLFLENMANSRDDEVRNLLQVSVLESLMSDKQTFVLLKKNMGESTFSIYEDILKYLKVK